MAAIASMPALAGERAVYVKLVELYPTLQLKKSRPATKRQVDYVSELLRRSGKTPLDIYIFSPYYEHKNHPILDVLLPHSDRWEMLTIEATPIVIAGLAAARGKTGSPQVPDIANTLAQVF